MAETEKPASDGCRTWHCASGTPDRLPQAGSEAGRGGYSGRNSEPMRALGDPGYRCLVFFFIAKRVRLSRVA